VGSRWSRSLACSYVQSAGRSASTYNVCGNLSANRTMPISDRCFAGTIVPTPCRPGRAASTQPKRWVGNDFPRIAAIGPRLRRKKVGGVIARPGGRRKSLVTRSFARTGVSHLKKAPGRRRQAFTCTHCRASARLIRTRLFSSLSCGMNRACEVVALKLSYRHFPKVIVLGGTRI
jgi:hypothetical protein